MKDVFVRLGSDFLSAILFLALYLTTNNLVLATSVAIAGAIAQLIYSRPKGRKSQHLPSSMSYSAQS
jgi:intracellular septation protein